MVFTNSEKMKQEKMDITYNKAESLGHTIISGYYENKTSKLIVYCNKHQFRNETKFDNYLRSPNGLKCCGIESKSKKLKDRIFSQETLNKMKTSALTWLISKKPMGPVDWRRNKEYGNWERKVISNWNFVNRKELNCVLTYDDNAVFHHLYSGKLLNAIKKSDNNRTMRYDSQNGIVIISDLHSMFHKDFGYGNNTISQFLKFLDIREEIIFEKFAAYFYSNNGSEIKKQFDKNKNRIVKRLIEMDDYIKSNYDFNNLQNFE